MYVYYILPLDCQGVNIVSCLRHISIFNFHFELFFTFKKFFESTWCSQEAKLKILREKN